MSELLDDIYVPQTHVVESILEDDANEPEEPEQGRSGEGGPTGRISDPDDRERNRLRG